MLAAHPKVAATKTKHCTMTTQLTQEQLSYIRSKEKQHLEKIILKHLQDDVLFYSYWYDSHIKYLGYNKSAMELYYNHNPMALSDYIRDSVMFRSSQSFEIALNEAKLMITNVLDSTFEYNSEKSETELQIHKSHLEKALFDLYQLDLTAPLTFAIEFFDIVNRKELEHIFGDITFDIDFICPEKKDYDLKDYHDFITHLQNNFCDAKSS